jgi:hypothetical protein
MFEIIQKFEKFESLKVFSCSIIDAFYSLLDAQRSTLNAQCSMLNAQRSLLEITLQK